MHSVYPALDIQGSAGLARADGLEHLRRNILFLVPGAESLDHVIQHLLGAARGDDAGRVLRLRQGQAVAQVQVQLFLDQDAQHRQRGPAQGKRIPGAGGRLADAKDTHQGIQPVRQSQGAGSRTFRQLVPGEFRPVLLDNRGRHLGRLAVIERVVVAGDALHIGELQHHFREQVGLAQQGRAAGELRR